MDPITKTRIAMFLFIFRYSSGFHLEESGMMPEAPTGRC